MFVGRKYELAELERAYQSKKFAMPVMYGRRRVGKTRLLREFSKDKKTIFFTAIESTEERNLELLSLAIYRELMPEVYTNMPPFQRYEDAFRFVASYAEKEKILFIIDEYPYLADASKEVSSILQVMIDEVFSELDMMLILCGSSMSFMEEQVLGYQSPLYGRRTEQYLIHPLSYIESAEFVKNYSSEDKALVYGFTGGIPKYLELVDADRSVKENIIDLFLKENGYLYEEPGNLLKQELRDPFRYNSIIEAVASGYTKLSEISSRVKLETGVTSHCIDKLISLGILAREKPVTEQKNKKKTYYSVEDSMFRFWYKFIPSGLDAILAGDGEYYYEEIVKAQLPGYMGMIFETMSRQYVMLKNHEKHLPLHVLQIGRWWGSHPVRKTEEEIDVVAINSMKKEALFGECKYTGQKTGKDVLDILYDRSELVKDVTKRYYILFSKNGYTREVQEAKDVILVTLEDMYR